MNALEWLYYTRFYGQVPKVIFAYLPSPIQLLSYYLLYNARRQHTIFFIVFLSSSFLKLFRWMFTQHVQLLVSVPGASFVRLHTSRARRAGVPQRRCHYSNWSSRQTLVEWGNWLSQRSFPSNLCNCVPLLEKLL